MKIPESVNRFVAMIWKETEKPLAIVITGTILLIITIAFLKMGVVLLNWFFTKECWFSRYMDFVSVAVLILSYLIFIIMGLFFYCHERVQDMRKENRGEKHE